MSSRMFGTRSKEQLALLCSAAGGNMLLILAMMAWLVTQLPVSGLGPGGVILSILLGLFMGDFVTGIFHWATDTWFDGRVWARTIAIAREHHVAPQSILEYDAAEYLGFGSFPSCLLVGPVALGIMIFAAPGPFVAGTMIVLFIVACVFLFGTYAHSLGHRRPDSLLVRRLQRLHLLIDIEHHRVHHCDGHLSRYCVFNGWANFVCDSTKFWRGLEFAVQAVTGAVPRANDHAWAERYRRTGASPGDRSEQQR
jgi:ubiquitin-conjugating enzyme E2 variant